MSDNFSFFSRGMITQETMKFYMIGKKKEGATPPSFLDSNDEYYILCQNEYSVSNNRKQRLYWSSDLNDMVRDYNSVSLNQGPVEMMVNYAVDNLSFSYLTQNGNILSNNKKVNNLIKTPSSIIPGVENKPQFFIPVQNEYNLNPRFLFYSVPYELRPNQNNNSINESVFPWCFRKSNGTQNTNVNIFTTNISDPNFNQKKLDSSSVTTVNISNPNISYSDNQISITGSPVGSFDPFPNKNGVIYIKKTSPGPVTDSIFYYKNKLYAPGNTGVRFTGIEEEYQNIYGSNSSGSFQYTTSYFNHAGSNFSMTVELRNDPNNFSNVTENISDWMNIYFIPSTENAYFSDVHLLTYYISRLEEIDRVRFNPEINYTIYCPASNNNINSTLAPTTSKRCLNFQKYFFSQFSTFFINYLLNGTTQYWKSGGYTAYPTIGKGPTNRNEEPDTKETIFTWARVEEAKAGFMYNYCLGNATCGSCYGNNPNGSTNCIIHHDTRQLAINYTTPGTLGAYGSGGGKNQPLSHRQTRKDLSSEFYAFIGINSGFLILLIIVLIIYGVKKSKSDAITNTESSINIKDDKL